MERIKAITGEITKKPRRKADVIKAMNSASIIHPITFELLDNSPRWHHTAEYEELSTYHPSGEV